LPKKPNKPETHGDYSMTSPAELCPYTDRAPYPGAQHVRICQISEITGCTNWNSPADYSRCPIALAHKKYTGDIKHEKPESEAEVTASV